MAPDRLRAQWQGDTPRRGSLADRLGPRATVLVVEDDGSIAAFLRAYFQASGTEVDHLDPDTPEQVGRWVEARRPACVLLDLRLRGFGGLDVYEQLRRSRGHDDIPVVVLTADPDLAAHAAGTMRPGDSCLTKPVDVRALFELVTDRIAVTSG